MKDSFIINALRNFKQTGSLFRSSNSLAKKLVEIISTENTLNIIELGAGDGIITKHILKKINPTSTLHSYEINENFAFKLNQIQDKRLTIHNSCVSSLKQMFPENKVDYIISSLPLANINAVFKTQLINDIKTILKPSGSLIQYQYSMNDLRFLKTNFPDTNTTLCIKNIPPALIYNCRNKIN